MEELRILQVSTLETTGGAARIAWYLHQAYRQRGIRSWMAVGNKESHDSTVFVIPNEPARGLWARSLLRLGRSLNMIDRRLPRIPPSKVIAWLAEPRRQWAVYRGREDFAYPGTHRLLQLVPEEPSIINCHNLHSGYFDLRLLPKLSRHVPLVLTLHDTWLLSGHCAYAINCERWKTGCGQCPDLSIVLPIKRDATAFNWSLKREIHADSRVYVVTPSRWLMDQVDQSMLAPAVIEGRVINNGVDLGVFSPGDRQAARAALGLPQEAAILLFVGLGGRANVFKDFDTIEHALARLGASAHSRALLLLSLGEEGAERQIGNARIRCMGYVKDLAQVAQVYRAADVYLHAARADTFPNVVLEALACGTPVVATAVGGVPEQVKEGVTGFLVSPRDSEAMAARTAQLLADRELAARMAVAAAEDARQRFSLNRQVDQYLEFFHEIAAR
jgi:glycosyltransferase involved in cell wall biosynthesis